MFDCGAVGEGASEVGMKESDIYVRNTWLVIGLTEALSWCSLFSNRDDAVCHRTVSMPLLSGGAIE